MRPVGLVLALWACACITVDAAAQSLVPVERRAMLEQLRATQNELTNNYMELAKVRLRRASEETARKDDVEWRTQNVLKLESSRDKTLDTDVELLDESSEELENPVLLNPGGEPPAAEGVDAPEDPAKKLDELDAEEASIEQQVQGLTKSLDEASERMNTSKSLLNGYDPLSASAPQFPAKLDKCTGPASLLTVHYHLLRGYVDKTRYASMGMQCLDSSAGSRGVWATVQPACDTLGEQERTEKRSERERDRKTREAAKKVEEKKDKQARIAAERSEKMELFTKATERDEKRIARLQINTGDIVVLESATNNEFLGVEDTETMHVRWSHTKSKRVWLELAPTDPSTTGFGPSVSLSIKTMFSGKYMNVEDNNLISKATSRTPDSKFVLSKLDDHSHNYSNVDPNLFTLNGDMVVLKSEATGKFVSVKGKDTNVAINVPGKPSVKQAEFKLIRKFREGDPTDGSGCFFDDLTRTALPHTVKFHDWTGNRTANKMKSCDLDGVTRTGEGCVLTAPGWDCPGTLDGQRQQSTTLMCNGGYWQTRNPSCTESGCFVDNLTVSHLSTVSSIITYENKPKTLGKFALATAAGCTEGVKRPHDSTCTFARPKYDCTTTKCEYGEWSDLDMVCTPKKCDFAWLDNPPQEVPAGGFYGFSENQAAVQRSGCTDGINENATICKWEKQGYDCDTTTCVYGVWSNPAPTCRPKTCKYDDLQLPTGASADEERCATGALLQGGFVTLPSRQCVPLNGDCTESLDSNGGCCAGNSCWKQNGNTWKCRPTCPHGWGCRTEPAIQPQFRYESHTPAAPPPPPEPREVTERTCTLQRHGYSCETTKCTLGVWSETGLECTPLPCAFNELSVPHAASASGTGCLAGGSVVSGAGCTIAKGGYNCLQPTCSLGNWSIAQVVCTPKPCPFDQLSVPEGAQAADYKAVAQVGPKNEIAVGYCTNWDALATGGQTTDTEQQCFARCAAEDQCEQAVYETGPYGTNCWLGKNLMTEKPTSSRDCSGLGAGQCHDRCFSKRGFGFSEGCDWGCYGDRYPDAGTDHAVAAAYYRDTGAKAGHDCTCAASQDGCESGSIPSHGTRCSINKPKHNCDDAQCLYGVFTTPKCYPDGCNYENLWLPHFPAKPSAMDVNKGCKYVPAPPPVPAPLSDGHQVKIFAGNNAYKCYADSQEYKTFACFQSKAQTGYEVVWTVHANPDGNIGLAWTDVQNQTFFCRTKADTRELDCSTNAGASAGSLVVESFDDGRVAFKSDGQWCGLTTTTAKKLTCNLTEIPEDSKFNVECVSCPEDKTPPAQPVLVSDQSVCNFKVDGWNCPASTCNLGSWSTGAFPDCQPKKCNFDDVVVPAGSSVSGMSCASGGKVANGTTCVVAKASHDCTSVTCEYGVWSSRAPTCGPHGCMLTNLTIPASAGLSPACSSMEKIPHSTTCQISRDGYDCQSSSCSFGTWTAGAPICTVKTCPFDQMSFPLGVTTGNVGNDTVGCKSGETMANGTSCIMSKEHYECTSPVTCAYGVLQPSPSCELTSCKFSDLVVPSGASASGDGCANSDIGVKDQDKCDFSKGGFPCEPVTCNRGTFDKNVTCDIKVGKEQAFGMKVVTSEKPYIKAPVSEALKGDVSQGNFDAKYEFQLHAVPNRQDNEIPVRSGDIVAILSNGWQRWVQTSADGKLEQADVDPTSGFPSEKSMHFTIETSKGKYDLQGLPQYLPEKVHYNDKIYLRSQSTGLYIGRPQTADAGCAVDDFMVGQSRPQLWCQKGTKFSSSVANILSSHTYQNAESLGKCQQLCQENNQCIAVNYNLTRASAHNYQHPTTGVCELLKTGNHTNLMQEAENFACSKLSSSTTSSCSAGAQIDNNGACAFNMGGESVTVKCCSGIWEQATCSENSSGDDGDEYRAISHVPNSLNAITFIQQTSATRRATKRFRKQDMSVQDDELMDSLLQIGEFIPTKGDTVIDLVGSVQDSPPDPDRAVTELLAELHLR